jgi:hypothetical protein
MLRHKPTGDLYIRTSLLAARDDMEAVDEPEEVVELVKKPAKPARKPVDALSAVLDAALDADAAD